MNANRGQKVSVHYVGTFDDGTEFDSSRTRGTPLSFELGSDTIMPAFQDAILQMTIGEKKTVMIESSKAYGPVNPEAFRVVPLDKFDSPEELIVGHQVHGQSEEGRKFSAIIEEIQPDGVKLNFNHPMAGKNLNFEIELLNAT